MAFDYEAARAEGYSDAEIADHLAKQYNFDIGGARKSGYNDTDILGHLAPKAGFSFEQRAEEEAQKERSKRSYLRQQESDQQQTEYEQGKTSNPFHGAIGRAANILGSGVEAVARLAEAGGDFLESKTGLSGLTEEQIQNERQLEPLFKFAQSAKNWSKSIGYEPSTRLDELTSNPLKAVPFIAERLISSSPDMAAAVFAMPAYFTSRTNEIINDRLKNDEKGLEDLTIGDVAAAAGAAGLEITLERFATKHLLKGAPITGKNAYTRVGKEVGFQSLTEGAEEGIGYLGGAAGTKRGVDPNELAQNVIEGSIVGGGLGGAVKGSQEYLDYRQKKKASMLAEGVDEDIADQALDQMDKNRDALSAAEQERMAGEVDIDKLEKKYFEEQYGGTEPPAPPAAAAPVIQPAPEAPVAQAAEVVQEPEAPALPAAELPPVSDKEERAGEVVLQNRDRSTPASVAQMQGIANNPDYLRLGSSNVATVGAPIVFGNVQLNEAQLGNETIVTDERGNRYPMQYAVVDAEDMLASNNADGTPNDSYATFQGLRAIGGNGRLAGMQAAYQRGTADSYRTELEGDTAHGINPEVIKEFKNPVLVRLMDPAMVDESTADNFNITGTQAMDTVSLAKNDSRRVDLNKLEFKNDGSLTDDAVKRFVAAMPVTEQNELIGTNGQPTKAAGERAEAAVFQKAYNNDELTNLVFSDTSEESKNIRRALNEVAPFMLQLEGMGEYDFRQQLNEAVMKAITAKRNGLSLEEAARQKGIDDHPLVNHIVQMFADNARSGRKIADNLQKLAALSAIEGKFIEDQLFEAMIQRRTPEEIVQFAFGKEATPEAKPKAEEKKAEAKKEVAPEEKTPVALEETKYAKQAGELIQKLKDAGLDEDAKILEAGMRTDARTGRLEKEGLAFREEWVRKRIAEKAVEEGKAEPITSIANKYDRLDRELFQRAVDAGMTLEEINNAVEDPYYMDMNDELATDNLLEAIAEKSGKSLDQMSIVLQTPLNNAKNETIRKQQITELQSIRQRMGAIQRRFAKAELQPLDEQIYSILYRQSKDLRDNIKHTYKPNVSPEKFLADAAKALADGTIEKEVFDVIDYLYRKYPNVLDGIRLSVRKATKAQEALGAAGQFSGLSRIVKLFKDTQGVYEPSTIRHEITHSLEQMMDAQARERVANVWRDKLLRAIRAEKTEAGKEFFAKLMNFLDKPSEQTKSEAILAMPNTSYYQYLTPSEFWAVNAEQLMKMQMGGVWSRFKKSVQQIWEGLKAIFGISNHWAIHRVFNQVLNGERIGQSLLDDYFIGADYAPVFSISKRKNYEGGPPPKNTWIAKFPTMFRSFNEFRNKYKERWFGSADENWIDTKIYNLMDKLVDLKRVQQVIGKISDGFDAYMKETLYHGRVATKLKNYVKFEMEPLLVAMTKFGVTKDELNTYLHNRHAEEYNDHINKINPNAQPDGPLYNKGSGISTDDARKYLAGLDPKKRQQLEKLASMVDKMVIGTQNQLVDGGIEKADTVQGWRKAFPKYVPLYRTELDFANTSAQVGKGFSTQAGFGKSATGSLKDVDDILSAIAAQRERAVVRSEKARVGRALYALAIQNPNTDFWLPVNPEAVKDKEKLLKELMNLGLSEDDAGNIIKEPEVPYIDPTTGMVNYRTNTVARNSPSVLAVPINGETRYVFFNPSDTRALRLVESLKNLDTSSLDGLMNSVAKVTRWIASVNTQYNPVFGLWNFWRDWQGALLNLTSTPIAGEQAEVMKNLPKALRGIYGELRRFRKSEAGGGEWAALWNDFMAHGGQTGFRDQFGKTEEQASIIDRKIKELQRRGIKSIPSKLIIDGAGGWLSDWNETLENSVRLSAYKVALNKGFSKDRAAEIAKNLTVNFNRKGAKGQQLNALYAFYNAAIQGSARLYQTITGPKGKLIMGTLFGLGVAQSLLMEAAGFDEDEPPEFTRQRNLIIPLPNGQYAQWAMPLGFNAFVNMGRLATDVALNNTVRKGKGNSKKLLDMIGVISDTFNPLGANGLSLQTIAPTILDPLAAIATNKDAFGRPIYKADQATNPTPGYMRSREGTFAVSRGIAQMMNAMTGGTDYQQGAWSPTADEIEYLAGQFTGGAGREVMKTVAFARDLATVQETPPYKIPIAGRLYGDIRAQANVSNKFYENVVELANYEHEIKGRRKNKEDVQDFLDEHPEAKLWTTINRVENQLSDLKKQRKVAVDRGDKERVKKVEDQMKRVMDQFNRRYESAKN